MNTDYDIDLIWDAVHNNDREEVRNILYRVHSDAYLDGYRDGQYDYSATEYDRGFNDGNADSVDSYDAGYLSGYRDGIRDADGSVDPWGDDDDD